MMHWLKSEHRILVFQPYNFCQVQLRRHNISLAERKGIKVDPYCRLHNTCLSTFAMLQQLSILTLKSLCFILYILHTSAVSWISLLKIFYILACYEKMFARKCGSAVFHSGDVLSLLYVAALRSNDRMAFPYIPRGNHFESRVDTCTQSLQNALRCRV